jgi:hypothetical protein
MNCFFFARRSPAARPAQCGAIEEIIEKRTALAEKEEEWYSFH